MTDHTWDDDDDDPDDEQFPSDLDALDFSDDRHSDEDDDDWSGLDAFTIDESAGDVASDSSSPLDTPDNGGPDDPSSGPVTFGVTNAAGTITAQATISGAINRVELSPSTTSMTESDLARNIMATADLAKIQARAIQRALVQSLLMHQGMDHHAAEQYIDDLIDLPTPAQFEAAQAKATADYLHEVKY